MELDWADIEETAGDIFKIWVDQPELRWAEEAWSKLCSQNLTEYSNELEMHIVLIRFITLGTLYHEFCEYAFEESANLDYNSWIYSLEEEGFTLHFLRLGQLLGPSFMVQEEIDESTQNILEKCVSTLVEVERKLIVAALINGFGNESLLFANLWLSRRILNEDDEFQEEDEEGILYEDSCPETIDDVLGYVTADKMKALEWIIDGMPGIIVNSYLDPCHDSTKHNTQILQEGLIKVDKSNLMESLIKEGESDQVEFKLGACSHPVTGEKNPSMIDSVARDVTAFMNSEGGKVFIGIDDEGDLVGVQREYKIANSQKSNKDGYELYLQDALKNKIDNGLIHLLFKIKIYKIKDQDICVIDVDRARDFAYFQEKVYVRQGNRSIEIKGKQLVEHTRSVGVFSAR